MNYSKNNRNLRNSKMMDQKPHYALRKLSVGVASVLLSTTLYMMESGNAQAATTSSNQTNQSLVQNTKNGGDNSQPTAQTGVNKQEADTQKQAKTPTTVEANAVSDTQTTEKTYKANLVDSTNQVIKTLTANGNVGATVNTNWTATDLPTGWKLADKQSLPTEVTINSDDAQNTANITIEHALRPATDEELKDLYNLSDDPGHSMYEIQKVYTRYISYYNGKYMPLAFPVDDESGWMNAIKGGRYVEQFVRYTWDTQIDEVTNKPVFSNFKLAEIKTKIFDGSTFSNDDLKYMADTYYLHGKYLDAMRKGALSILLSDNRLSKYVQVVTGSYELQGESYQFKPGCVYSIADAMSFPMMTKKVEHYTTPQFTNKGVSFNDIDFSNFDVQKEMDKVHKVWPSGSSLNSPADVASVLHDTYAIAYTPCDSEKFIHKQAISDADLNNLIANAKKSKVISDQDQEKWMVTPDTADVGSGVAVVKSGSIDNSLMWKVIPYTVLSTQDVDGPNVKTAKTPLSYMVGDTISDDDAAKALDKDTIPSDATVVWVTKPSTKEAGSQAGKVKVTFGDGTYQDYDVNVNVANYATAQVELVDGTGTVKDSVDSYAKTHLGKTVTTLTVQGKPGETVTTNWASQIPDGWQLAPNQTLPDTVTLSSDGTV
ncbi:YSIRK-type signal peptide-containing protein, partial [Lactobacillus psittaci]